MKPTVAKALNLVYVLSFLPLLLVEGYLCSWILSIPFDTVKTGQTMLMIVLFCASSFLFGVYLGVPTLCRRIRAKKIQFSFIYLLGCIILVSLTIMLLPDPSPWFFGGHTTPPTVYTDIGFKYLTTWFFIGSHRFIIPLPLGLIPAGFFLTKAF